MFKKDDYITDEHGVVLRVDEVLEQEKIKCTNMECINWGLDITPKGAKVFLHSEAIKAFKKIDYKEV